MPREGVMVSSKARPLGVWEDYGLLTRKVTPNHSSLGYRFVGHNPFQAPTGQLGRNSKAIRQSLDHRGRQTI